MAEGHQQVGNDIVEGDGLKIGWVNDYGPGEHPGGSLTTQIQAVKSMPCEHEIVWCLPGKMYDDCDLYVVNNHMRFDENELAFVADSQHVYWSHDVTPGPHKLKEILNNSKRVVFLSALHKDVFMWMFGKIGKRRTRLIPAMVNPIPFMGLEPIQDREALWVGTYERHRGVRSAMEWAEENETEVDFYGLGRPFSYLRNSEYCHIKNPVPVVEIPKLMAHYKKLVIFPLEIDGHDGLPVYCEACSRVAIEAAMAGCEVIHNDRLGVASWEWFRAGRKATLRAMANAPRNFWYMIEAVND